MKIGILGSGDVGKQLASGLVKINHDVMIGTRDVSKLGEWKKQNSKVKIGSFSDSAKFGEVIFICTLWSGTENALNIAGKNNFENKIVVDVTNPLDFSVKPPKLLSAPGKSAGEQVQKWLPKSKVVKAFNTIGNTIMVSPKREEGDPTFFICGNDESKKEISEIAKKLGWKDVIDLGDISNAYLLEALAMTWIEYAFKNNSWGHALKLLKK